MRTGSTHTLNEAIVRAGTMHPGLTWVSNVDSGENKQSRWRAVISTLGDDDNF